MNYINPIIEQRADPHIYKHTDGYYYFTASVPEYDRIELRRAKTLAELNDSDEIISVWHKPESSPYSALIWAPEIHYIDNQRVIYFAAAPSREIKDELFQHCMYAIISSAENPVSSSWHFAGQVDTGIDSFCLDATSFVHNEQHYYVWAQKSPEIQGNSNLYIARMASLTELATPPVLLSKPDLEWEQRGFWVNEGPSVIHRHGKFWMTYSASATDENYCMGLLCADEDADLLDPQSWEKSTQPVLVSNYQDKIFGPGHNSFTVAEDGQDLLVYHARNYTEIEGDPLWDPNRHTRVQALQWLEGKPVFGKAQ